MKKIVTNMLVSTLVLSPMLQVTEVIAETTSEVASESQAAIKENTSGTESSVENNQVTPSSSFEPVEKVEADDEVSDSAEQQIGSTVQTSTVSSVEESSEVKPLEDLEISDSVQEAVRAEALKIMETVGNYRSQQKATVPERVTSFVEAILPSVRKLSIANNLYASVMMAQASLESAYGTSTLASAPNYNLFGVKYSGVGDYVEMETIEYDDNQVAHVVIAKFQKYNSYEESLQDYVKKIRKGVSWDANYYAGVWKENTKTYQDATAALTGRYATDPNYGTKLNNVIETYGFTQYDVPEATYTLTGQNLNKTSRIASNSYYIYTAPYGTKGAYRAGKLADYFEVDSGIIVTMTATTSTGVKVCYIQDLGWVDYRALGNVEAAVATLETRNTNMRIADEGYYVYRAPYKTYDSVKLKQLSALYKNGQAVPVTQYAVTSKGVKTYYIENVGWVDHRSLGTLATYLEDLSFVARDMKVINTSYYVYTNPYHTADSFRNVLVKDKYKAGDAVRVTRYATTSEGVKTYYIENIGWVDYRVLGEFATFTEDSSFVAKNMKVKDNGYYFYSAPYNTSGSKQGTQVKIKYAKGDAVRVTRYGTTSTGVKTYYIENVGWVDYRALSEFATYTDDTNFVSKNVRIKDNGYKFYRTPYNTENSVATAAISTKFKVNDQVRVTRYGKTSEGIKTYYIENAGWVDYRAIKEMATYTDDANFKAKNMRIKNNGYNIYKTPYNTTDSVVTSALSKKYNVNDLVRVTRYGKTSEGIKTYYIENVGWVDYRAVKEVATIKSEKTLNKSFAVKNNGYNIYSAPFNTADMKLVGSLKSKYSNGSVVTVTKQVTTSEGVQVYYIKNVGWVDHRALTESIHAEKMKKVQTLLNNKYNSSRFGIYVESMGDHSTASINANKRYTAPSTGKLPAIYYTQKQINAGKIKPTAKYLYTDAINNMTNAYMRGGAGILQSKPKNKYYSIDEILNWTIKYSDNQGTNFLAYYACGKYDATMKKEISNIIGRTWDSPFSITAKENAKLMEAIYKQGGQATQYLQNTVYDNQRIPKYLPVKVGHKIGDVYDYRHDVAIVYANTPFVLSVMTSGNTSYETISVMAKEIYDILK
ncbi:serine hydrolase [Vagococcus zengguangii]|uniref:GW domain-containing protein n=1 Tax=Vagococcus zengguangii TaxID=2571750 RepID=A0A4D7CZS6_9ENTE|nr:serine hydrolase [Vagococcus zengguangii]QCI87036.1 hypothetical protein FA707_08690 [Vagococcus zengguangii]